MRAYILFYIAALCTVAQIVTAVIYEVRSGWAAAVVALLLGVLGAIFVYWSMIVLRKHGNPVIGASYMPTATMVERGPYAIVRHPQYLGYILINLTFVLSNPHWLGCLLGAAAIAAFYLFTLQEDNRLREAFGADYRAYSRRVPGLNPVLHLPRLLGG